MSLPASKRFVSINCNDYVKVPKINDISVNSTVHDDCPLKRINIGIVKAPITVSLPNLEKGQLMCSSDFLKPLLVHIALTHTKGLLLYLELGCSYIEFTQEQEQVKIVDLQNVSARVFLYLHLGILI